MADRQEITELRERLAPLGFAVVHIDALRVAQVYLEVRGTEGDEIGRRGVDLGDYGNAINAVDDAIQAHDRARFRAITKRAKR